MPEQHQAVTLDIIEDALKKAIRGTFWFPLVYIPRQVWALIRHLFPTFVKLTRIAVLSTIWTAICFGPHMGIKFYMIINNYEKLYEYLNTKRGREWYWIYHVDQPTKNYQSRYFVKYAMDENNKGIWEPLLHHLNPWLSWALVGWTSTCVIGSIYGIVKLKRVRRARIVAGELSPRDTLPGQPEPSGAPPSRPELDNALQKLTELNSGRRSRPEPGWVLPKSSNLSATSPESPDSGDELPEWIEPKDDPSQRPRSPRRPGIPPPG